jgi:hypothetical protein
MPNWVTNKVVIIGKAERITEIVALMKGKENSNFDFNKVIPMPVELVGTRSPSLKTDPFLIAKYGSDNWYDWCCKNWGTKWNASAEAEPHLNAKGTRLTYFFATAWSTPAPVLEKLAEKFPDVKIKVWYADEDRGNNVGWYTFNKGVLDDEAELSGLSSGRRLAQRLG